MKKVSIIVPVYNVEEYIIECISSVLNQTYGHYELVLIDDGSKDGSGQICDRYADKYREKIKSFHTCNQGPFAARAKGINISNGDILVFLDADDCLRTDALESLVNCFQIHECDMVLYNAGECEAFTTKRINYPFTDEQVFEGESKNIIYRELVMSAIPNSLCLKAVKRTSVSLPADINRFSHIKHGEDLLMSVFFLTDCSKIVYLDQGLYHYRVRQGSAVHTFNMNRTESIKAVHTELEKYIQIWKMPELKAAHDARKVKGWMESLWMLLDNRQDMPKAAFTQALDDMAEDGYFRAAYRTMDSGVLQSKHRISAWCLYHKRYRILYAIMFAKRLVK